MELRACIAEYFIHQNWPVIDILKSIMSVSASYSFNSTVKIEENIVFT